MRARARAPQPKEQEGDGPAQEAPGGCAVIEARCLGSQATGIPSRHLAGHDSGQHKGRQDTVGGAAGPGGIDDLRQLL